MRRHDKEIVPREEIDAVIHAADVCRLGFAIENEPYVVPISFGYDGAALFIHTAGRGRKIDCIDRNNRICFELEANVQIKTDETEACKWTFEFESVIGRSASDFDAEETFSLAELNKSTFCLRAQFHLQQHGGNKLTFDGDEVVVNRDSLDQNNASISRKEHARFNLRNGAWYVTDLSSNNASFVQLRKTTPIADGTALVFGRKVFTFHCRS